ncbi:MAG TPA: MMPL family transporter [Verrucomicrobiae bacterium]|nr:MMPL family transporter [Verrucomicrobiae bacterium]
MTAIRARVSNILTAAPSWMHWLLLALTAALIGLVVVLVDLTPHVDEDFFFSVKDPQFQQTKKIEASFPNRSQLIISVSSPDISSEHYLERIGQLTEKIKAINQIVGVRSLAEGPKSFSDAMASPLWRRLLIAGNQRSSNLIVLIEGKEASKLIRRVEDIVKEFDEKDFVIRIAGAPYVVAMIQRNLVHDFAWFSATAVILFGGAMLPIFRSVRILVGMLATCISAIMVSLLVQALLGMKIGILTANLSTIVFVLTFSHLVYMTSNWRNLAHRRDTAPRQLAAAAYGVTLPPSFWCMVCTSLGFATLLLVQAKPLRELGLGGTIGTIAAFLCAYTIYPFFLRWAVPPDDRVTKTKRYSPFGDRRFILPVALLLIVTVSLAFGLRKLNTDPSLLDYFKPHQPLRDGLEYVDRNGGSSPLELVVATTDGRKLNTSDAYEKMWQLQGALENQPAVGTVVSLPVLMAEGNRAPLAFLLTWENLLRIMEKPEHGRVAASFINEDHTQAVFLLRMVESGRQQYRAEIVDDLRSIVRQQGFEPVLVGGVYQLQGDLARLVSASMLEGLGWLFAVFLVVALIITRSFRTAVAMIISLSLCRFCMLGAAGFLKVPVDIISAPAANVCIGMAVDSMIHLVFAVRRNRRLEKDSWKVWVAARDEQWRAVAGSATIIATGFAIFTLSNFPPTQRFGLVVIFGTLIDIMATLLVLPLLSGAHWKTVATR